MFSSNKSYLPTKFGVVEPVNPNLFYLVTKLDGTILPPTGLQVTESIDRHLYQCRIPLNIHVCTEQDLKRLDPMALELWQSFSNSWWISRGQLDQNFLINFLNKYHESWFNQLIPAGLQQWQCINNSTAVLFKLNNSFLPKLHPLIDNAFADCNRIVDAKIIKTAPNLYKVEFTGQNIERPWRHMRELISNLVQPKVISLLKSMDLSPCLSATSDFEAAIKRRRIK